MTTKHRKRSVESKRNNWRVAKPICARTVWMVTSRGKANKAQEHRQAHYAVFPTEEAVRQYTIPRLPCPLAKEQGGNER